MTDTTIVNDWGISLRLNDRYWFSLIVGGEPDMGYLEAQVDTRIQREPQLLDSRQKLIDMLVYFGRDATRRGAAAAATRWALDELDGVSVATLYMSSYVDEKIGTANLDDLIEFLQARMAPRHANDYGNPTVEVRELTPGPAVRVEVITNTEVRRPEVDGDEDEPTTPGQRRAMLLETVQYWCPVPERNIIIVFTFTTPNLAGAEALVGEFDRIMERYQVNL